MPHREYVRLVPGADTAVLFLHGIVGTPRHFDSRLPLVQLVPEQWSVYNLLLPGHGGSVETFSNSTMKQWKEYVWRVFGELARKHRHVIIVAHSMGTLFAVQLAIEYRDKIPFMLLIAAPICPQVSFGAVTHAVGLVFPHSHSDPKIHNAMAQSGSVTLTKKVWKYMPWIPNLCELLKEAQHTKKQLPLLQTKTIVVQSHHDELVSRRSAKFLSQCPCVQLTTLPNSTHFYYTGPEKRIVQQAFLEAMKELHL